MTIVALDFETANRSPASACAIGLAFVEDGAVTRRLYSLVRPPELVFDPGNIRVHGIRPTDVLDAPEFPDLWRDIEQEFGGALVLAHNASFDMRVLAATLAHYRLPQPCFDSFCTVSLARRLWPEEPSKRLSALAAKFGIGFRHHHAGEDAMACAEIALEGARQAGAACVNELADRLSLRKRVAAASARREGGIADRAMAARMGRPKIENVLRFRVSGSKGTPYDMVLRTDGRSDRKLFCSCPGAKFRAECRHMKSLLSGDYRAVMVGSEEEGRQLSTLLSASLRVFDAA
ncbi:3'-5' exonuclease [Aureimonas psammosilenae]|uniref:3'-5' exonuclease n=1 Tax=Aureimonas psammosilenae TaxID=2495496 RepID=UPI0012604301|nr:3'-5' exonuclease [Aureimonas psammosilenae]